VPLLPGAEPYASDGGDVGVLLCHGFTGCPQSLRPWAEHHAAAGLTVRLPRLPGHGTTWRELDVTRWDDWYACVDTALHELSGRCRAVVVAGLSMGGALALRLAEEHGPAVSGVVLVNAAVRLDDWRLAALPVLRRLRPSIPGIASDIAKPGVREVAYDRTPLGALASMLSGYQDVVRDLPEVSQPLLVLRSAVDHVVPASSTALVLQRVSSTDVTERVLERSFHVATLDHDADLIAEESLAFVERVTALPAPVGPAGDGAGSRREVLR
jgi:carboxylesterase